MKKTKHGLGLVSPCRISFRAQFPRKMAKNKAENGLAAAISGVVSCIQLQTDAIEAMFGLHDWDSDDEESLILLAGPKGLLRAPGENTDSSSDSSSDSKSGLNSTSTVDGRRKWGKRKLSPRGGASEAPVSKKANHLGYFEITVPLYADAEFRQSFHLSRHVYEVLLRKLVPLMVPAAKDAPLRSGRPPIPLEKKILIVLWFFATQQPFRLIAERFEVSKASVEDSYRKVVAALVQLGDEYIRWPSADQAAHVAAQFEEKTGLSRLLGVIGTARFGLKTAKMAPKFYSDPMLGGCTVTSLFVCDQSMRFLDCYPGLPGSLSNVMVLRNSSLHASILANHEVVFPGGTHLIGDPSFPVEPWLITPFHDDGELPPIKQAFNNAITLALNTRHRAVALLKGRFPRLNKPLGIGRLDYLPACINVAFILHNVCLSEDEDDQDQIQEYVNVGWESAIAEFKATVGMEAGDADVDADPDRCLQGCEKRNTVCNMYAQTCSRLA